MDIVAKLNSLSRRIAEVEEDAGEGGKGKPNAMIIEFIKEMGDREVSNPNPNKKKDRIKLKSLQNTEYGKNDFDRYFSAWAEKKKRENKDKKEKE